MSLRVDMRTANATLSVTGRSARELLNALGSIGRRLDEQTLSSWLVDLEREGLARRDGVGRWSLTTRAMKAFGSGLSMIERPNDGNA